MQINLQNSENRLFTDEQQENLSNYILHINKRDSSWGFMLLMFSQFTVNLIVNRVDKLDRQESRSWNVNLRKLL